MSGERLARELEQPKEAAAEVGRLASRILELAAVAGLYVRIRIEPLGQQRPRAELLKAIAAAADPAAPDVAPISDERRSMTWTDRTGRPVFRKPAQEAWPSDRRVTTTPKLPGDLEVTSRDIVRHQGGE